jgi:hypothetical protein
VGVDLIIEADVRTGGEWHRCPEPISLSRNRDLFAVLTGWNDPPELMEPVAAFLPLRGLPDDLSPELHDLRQLAADPASGTSHFQWLLAREVLDFPWHERQVTHHFHPDKSRPLGYLVKRAPDGTYRQSYAEFAGYEWMELVLPCIRGLGPPDDTRVVYFLAG